MKRSHIAKGVGAALALAFSTNAFAIITDVNGLRIQLRRFNDYPSSTLSVTPPPPGSPATPQSYAVAGLPNVVLNEGPFGAGGFANQHVARLSSTAGASDYLLSGPPGMSNDAFDISFNVTMSIGSTAPRKEAGFRMDSFIGGESFFFITSDGEVAAFGGPLPFHSFGGAGTYVPGNTANLRMIYRPDDDPVPTAGDASTVEFLYDSNVNDATPAVSSGLLEFSNSENGFITGSDIGMYVQNQPNDNNAADFSNVTFANISVAIPEPASAALIALFGGMLAMRRRR